MNTVWWWWFGDAQRFKRNYRYYHRHLHYLSQIFTFFDQRYHIFESTFCNFPTLGIILVNTKKYHVFAPIGRFQLESIYLYFPPSFQLLYIYMFLSCRPFVAITTLSTDLVGVEVTSVSWLGLEVTSTPTRPVDNVVIATKGLQDRNIYIYNSWNDGGK